MICDNLKAHGQVKMIDARKMQCATRLPKDVRY
jgi:predicted carbohydrate-binding protein with CBM5 and CBM33 domain